MCGAHLKDRKREELDVDVGLHESIDQLTTPNSVRWYSQSCVEEEG